MEETTSDKAELESQWQVKLADSLGELSAAKHALDEALQSKSDAVTRAAAVEQENKELKKELQQKQDDQTAELKLQLSRLRSDNAKLTSQITDERTDSTETIMRTSKELSNLRATLRSRDDAIQSLQTRVEKYHRDTTILEEQLDRIRKENSIMSEGKVKERADLINNLTESAEKLKQELKDMTAKWEKQKDDYEAQVSVAETRREEIKILKEELHQRELDIEQSKLSSSRVTALEVELQRMNERVDELTTALDDAVDEIDNLRVNVSLKEERIESLEKEIQEASDVLEKRTDDEHVSQPRSGNFSRLREEIENVTRERAQLESDHAHQLKLLESSKNCDIARLEKELSEVHRQLKVETEKVATLKSSLEEIEISKANLSNELEKTREIMDQLDAEEDRELVEANKKVSDLQLAYDELQCEINELRSIQLVGKAHETARDEIDTENRKSLSEQLFSCEEELQVTKTKRERDIREKEMVISDLKSEISAKEKYAEELRNDLESLQLSVERGPTKRNYGMAIDPEWHDADTVTKLKFQVSTLSKEKRMIENELRAKIETRDATVRNCYNDEDDNCLPTSYFDVRVPFSSRSPFWYSRLAIKRQAYSR